MKSHPFFFLTATLVVSLAAAANASAQIIYTDGETNTAPIVITPTSNPTTLSVSSGTATQSGAISQSGVTGVVVINGAGTLILTGPNTYSGSTSVQAGTLLVNGINSTGSGAISVSSGADLGGDGSISAPAPPTSPAVRFASGSTLNQSAVTGGLGTATLALNLTGSGSTNTVDLLQGTKFAFDLASSGVSDQVNITGGTLTLSGQSLTDFDFTTLSGFTGGGTYDLITTGASGDILGSLGTTTGTVDGFDASLSIVNGQDLVLSFDQATPEPAAWLLGTIALLAFAGLRARRRV